jgi:predicted nucleotidyltransferase
VNGAVDAIAIATAIASSDFPDACGAWLVGSAARGDSTATSDIDVLVVRPEGSVYRDTFRADGQLVELFVHTLASLEQFYEREEREYRCGLAHMLATGSPLLESEAADDLQRSARELVAQGPPDRTLAELDALRYHLSAAIDDLTGSPGGDEVAFIAHHVLALASELELAHQGAWTGRGRWLYRWLEVASPVVAQRLADASRELPRDRTPLVAIASEVLERAGGRLQEGYRLTSETDGAVGS